MASPYTSVGMAQGFDYSLDSARQRRIDEEERKRRYSREDLQQEGAEFDLSRAKTNTGREDDIYARQKEEFQRRNQEEGFLDFTNALVKGVDPAVAMEQFNNAGNLKLKDVRYERGSGRLSITDTDGETKEFENPSQLLAAVGIQPGQPDPVKLGKDDRLVDPSTGKTVVDAATSDAQSERLVKVGNALYDTENDSWKLPPDSEKRYIKVDKSLYDTESGEWLSPPNVAGEGDGRDTATFNPESTLQKVEQGIVRSHGGTFDALGNYSLPGDRGIVDTKMGLAGDMFARLVDHVREQRISYTEIQDAVIKASKGLSTDSELEKAGEEWRTDGFNKSQEEKQQWVESERQRQIADARVKLLGEEQRLLTKAGKAKAQEPTATQKPEWAGTEIPASNIGDAQLDPTQEYDVELNGRRITIRVAPDGKVYEVRGRSSEPQASARPEAPAAPEPETPAAVPDPAASLANARPTTTSTEDDQPTLGDRFQSLGAAYRDKRGLPNPKVRRALQAMESGNSIAPNDAEFLNALDDSALRNFGLSDEQIAEIRALFIADQSLASAKRQQPDFTY